MLAEPSIRVAASAISRSPGRSGTLTPAPDRHHARHRSSNQLFEAARIKEEWTVQQPWVGYLAVGGTAEAFDIEAYLQGLG